jgi:methylenetetrahydrofolate reductase (NADPH)
MLSAFYSSDRFGLSFELFPPKTDAGQQTLFQHVAQLAAHLPDFFTCTYGAGGSTRDRTLEIVAEVKRRFGLPVASHLTCVGATTDQLQAYLQAAAERDVDYIVALRGDPPAGQTHFAPTAGGLRYANELVSLIREQFPRFGIAVAGYPETHREAPSAAVDLENLKRKTDAGADIVITQLFYDNRDFFDFADRCRLAGIHQPIIPGLLPVTNLSQIQRITSLCGARLPADFVAELGRRDDEQWQFEVGVDFAVRQVRELVERGVPGIHFYVLNKSQATIRILESVELPGRTMSVR